MDVKVDREVKRIRQEMVRQSDQSNKQLAEMSQQAYTMDTTLSKITENMGKWAKKMSKMQEASQDNEQFVLEVKK